MADAPAPVRHEAFALSSQIGWLGACKGCKWTGDGWHRAKNSAMRDARDHVRSESIAAGRKARR